MTAVIPSIHIFNVNNPNNNRPGIAGKVALIGAFNTEETNPQLYVGLNDAIKDLGDDATFNGCSVLEELFVGASSILAVNTTTWTGTGESKTPEKDLTVQKLSDALAKIKGEDFDILFVADMMTSTYLPIISAFCDEVYEMKSPCGYLGYLNGNASANVQLAAGAGDHCYGLLTQELEVNGVDKTALQSIAYYTGLLAGMNVGNTMSMKVVDGVTGVSPEYTFETGDTGKAYVEAGITTLRCLDRNNNRFVVVNSEQPNGYDLYINRVRDYVVKEMSLSQYLGERNRTATLSEIEHMLASLKEDCVNNLDLLEDIQYTVKKKNANCVDIYLDSLTFAGIITRIDVYVRVEVE